MTETNPQAGHPVKGGVTPYLNIEGVAAAAEFYKTAFGAEELVRMPADDGKRMMHLCLRINDGYLMFSDPFPEHGHPAERPAAFSLHLQVDDVEAWWKRATEAGCEITMPLADMFWGDRYGQVRDAWGVHWSMAQRLG